jgi:hypothetical protein
MHTRNNPNTQQHVARKRRWTILPAPTFSRSWRRASYSCRTRSWCSLTALRKAGESFSTDAPPPVTICDCSTEMRSSRALHAHIHIHNHIHTRTRTRTHSCHRRMDGCTAWARRHPTAKAHTHTCSYACVRYSYRFSAFSRINSRERDSSARMAAILSSSARRRCSSSSSKRRWSTTLRLRSSNCDRSCFSSRSYLLGRECTPQARW